MPADVLGLCRRLREAGHEAYLVGGGVRDLLLGRPVHDWDVATSARPAQVQRLFRRTIPVGIAHGTVVVLLPPPAHGGEPRAVEVTTYRGEVGYSDGRHPDRVTFVDSLEADLSRRDFTVNAMALDPATGEVHDPLGGEADLGRGVLRTVGEAAERFAEDGLRVMRGLRFAATLELEVDPATLAAMGPARPVLARVSHERIRDELLKMLGAPAPSRGLRLMARTGVLGDLLPELAEGVGLHQNVHHPDDVFEHCLRVCDALPPGDPVLRLAGLLHDVGKPEVAAPHPDRPDENTFHAHEKAGARRCEAVARRLRLSAADRRRVCHLVAHHMFPLDGWTAAGLRRLLRRVGEDALDDLFALKRADIVAKHDSVARESALEALRQRIEALRHEQPPLSVRDLAVDGRQLMDHLGLSPGPRVGELLGHLLERVTDDPAANRTDALLAEAERWIREDERGGSSG